MFAAIFYSINLRNFITNIKKVSMSRKVFSICTVYHALFVTHAILITIYFNGLLLRNLLFLENIYNET